MARKTDATQARKLLQVPKVQDPVLRAMDYHQRGLEVVEIASLMNLNAMQVKTLLRRGKALVGESTAEDSKSLLSRFDPHRLNRVLSQVIRRLDELEARFDILPPEYRRDMPPGLWQYMLSCIPTADIVGLPGDLLPRWQAGESIPPLEAREQIEKLYAKAIDRRKPRHYRTHIETSVTPTVEDDDGDRD